MALEREMKEKHFQEVLEQMEQAVAAGKLKPEQAREKIAAIRKQIFEQEREIEREHAHRRELEREHARRQLELREREHHEQLRREHEHQLREHEERLAAKEMEFKEVVDKVQKAIQEGELSKEDGHRKLMELREKMFHSDDKRDRERKSDRERRSSRIDVLKKRIAKDTAKIKEAIEIGELTEEEGEKKLFELHKRVEEHLKKQAPNFFGRIQKNAKVQAAQLDIKTMHQAAKMYMLNTGKNIEDLEDLVRLPKDWEQLEWGGPYLEELRNDPWGNPYQSKSQEGELRIASNGPDGKGGTDDDVVK